jgi:hypothetical protein
MKRFQKNCTYLPISGLNQEPLRVSEGFTIKTISLLTDTIRQFFLVTKFAAMVTNIRNRAAASTYIFKRACIHVSDASVANAESKRVRTKKAMRIEAAGSSSSTTNFCSRARGNANNGSEHEVAVWLNKSENCESALAGGGGGGGDGGVAVELWFVPHSKESEIIFLLQGCYMEPSPAAMYIKHGEMGKTGSNWRTEQTAPAAHLALKRALFAAQQLLGQIE